MSDSFRYGFEQYRRVTAPKACTSDFEQLYDTAVFATHGAVDMGFHYAGKHVGAVMPVYDTGEDTLFYEPTLKLVSAGSFKPVREADSDARYTRVCAEQNLIDNGLHEGDLLLGALFLRFRNRPEQLEGNVFDGAFLCGPCRNRALRVIGPNIVVVSFVGENDEPEQVMTIGQMNDIQEFGQPVTPLATGPDIRRFIIEEVFKTGDYQMRLRNKPRVPSRIYKRPTNEQKLPFISE
jgi:hypothetical protein